MKEQTKIEPELSAEEQKKLDDDWNIKMTEKEDRKALRVSVLAQACKAWQIPAITEPRPWGTKKKSVMWDDKLRDFLASEYNALRLDATTVIGTKPVMPENWNPKDPSVVLRLARKLCLFPRPQLPPLLLYLSLARLKPLSVERISN